MAAQHMQSPLAHIHKCSWSQTLRALGRCATHVRPLLTPSVAQQGVFVWYPGVTGREGGGRLMFGGRATAAR